jgi:hypothetical protein
MLEIGGWLLIYGVAASDPHYSYTKSINWGAESRCIAEAQNKWREFYATPYPNDGVQRTFGTWCQKNDKLLIRKIICNEQMECGVW